MLLAMPCLEISHHWRWHGHRNDDRGLDRGDRQNWVRRAVYAKIFLEPSRVLLIKDGRINYQGMRREHFTRGELTEQLRIQGAENIAEVKRMYIEPNGQVSVINIPKLDSTGESTLDE